MFNLKSVKKNITIYVNLLFKKPLCGKYLILLFLKKSIFSNFSSELQSFHSPTALIISVLILSLEYLFKANAEFKTAFIVATLSINGHQ